MYGYNKKDYLKMEPNAVLVCSKKLHELLDIVLEVYYSPKADTPHSAFILFAGEEMITNTLLFPCDIPKDFRGSIATDYINAFISKCNFEELDKEKKGQCACYPNKRYSKCNDCPDYNKECLGPTFFMPHHVNYWDEVSKVWDGIYGEKGTEYKRILIKKARNDIGLLFFRFGKTKKERKKLIKEILKNQ